MQNMKTLVNVFENEDAGKILHPADISFHDQILNKRYLIDYDSLSIESSLDERKRERNSIWREINVPTVFDYPERLFDEAVGHISYFGRLAVVERFPDRGILPMKCNEVLAMVSTVMQNRLLTISSSTQPVFLTAPRQTGKTTWLVKMAELLSVIYRNQYRVIVVTRNMSDASFRKEKYNRLKEFVKQSDYGKFITYTDVQYCSISEVIQSKLINKDNTLLLLDDYEFYPTKILEMVLFDADHFNVIAGASCLNKDLKPTIDTYKCKLNAAQMYLERICMQLTMKDDWVFRDYYANSIIKEYPIRVVLDGRDIMSCAANESRLKKILNEDEMNSEFYMIRN